MRTVPNEHQLTAGKALWNASVLKVIIGLFVTPDPVDLAACSGDRGIWPTQSGKNPHKTLPGDTG